MPAVDADPDQERQDNHIGVIKRHIEDDARRRRQDRRQEQRREDQNGSRDAADQNDKNEGDHHKGDRCRLEHGV